METTKKEKKGLKKAFNEFSSKIKARQKALEKVKERAKKSGVKDGFNMPDGGIDVQVVALASYSQGLSMGRNRAKTDKYFEEN